MSSLAEKLKDLGVQVGASGLTSGQGSQPKKQDLLNSFPGSWESTSAGECFVIRKELPRSASHGAMDLSEAPNLGIFEKLDSFQGMGTISPSQFLYIDTETTGLSGGAGTYVFLVGAAKLVEDEIHFAQFFLQDPASEPAQLAALESFSASAKVLISYNGKSFDLPRIRTRYRYHGWPDPFPDIYHLDLLHVARRIWKDYLPGCTLGDLEQHLLGLQRSSLDIPGWKVSEFFFNYLIDGDPVPLESVFYHNEVDVLSLIALLGYISRRLSSPLKRLEGPAYDQVSIARYLSFLGHRDAALDVLDNTLSLASLPRIEELEGSKLMASLYKQMGNYQEALPFWKRAASLGSIDSKIELAMHFEHREKDLEEAIHWTLSALADCPTVGSQADNSLTADLQYRLDRLKKKAKH